MQPAPRAILLDNDRVLHGEVETRGGITIVHLGEGSSVSITNERVRATAANIEGLYDFKVKSIQRWNAGDHFKMTRWCIANGLLPQATEHYSEVSKVAGGNSRVKSLAVELKNEILKVDGFRAYLGLAPLNAPSVTLAAATNSHHGTQLGHNQAADGAVSAPPATLPTYRATPPQLSSSNWPPQLTPNQHNSNHVAQAAATGPPELHPRAIAFFSDELLPIMVNRCGQAACHGGLTDTNLKVIAPFRQRDEEVARNLMSVMPFTALGVDGAAELLTKATTAHGVQTAPSLAAEEVHLKRVFETWIHMLHSPVVSAEGNSHPNYTRPSQAEGWQAVASAGAANPALTPVTPGAAPLRAVPTPPDQHGLSAVGAAPLGFPAGAALPTDAEIDALEKALERLLMNENAAVPTPPPPTGSIRTGPAPSPLPPQTGQSPAASPAAASPSAGPASADPFDPQEFNRRHSSKAATSNSP